MNSTPIRAAGKALGTWLAIVAFVAFLTFAFNFLGTILCAVVIGMMMAGTRHAKWQIIPISLVFPAVVLLMLRLVKSELARDQMHVVAGLCFGAFWLTFGLTLILRSVEGKQPPCGKPAKPGVTAEKTASTPASAQQPKEVLCASPPVQVLELKLEMLQGWWEGQTVGDPPQRRRTLEIADDQIAVKGFTADGHVSWEAKGGLRVDGSTHSAQLVSSPAAGNGSNDACVMI